MKSIILKSVVAFTITFFSIANIASAQSSYLYPDAKFETAVKDLKQDIKALGFKIETVKTVKVKEGKTASLDLPCKGDKYYMVFTYSENGVRNIALDIYNSRGENIAKDENILPGVTASIFVSSGRAAHTVKAELTNEYSRKSRKAYKMAVIVTSVAIPDDSYSSTNSNYQKL